MPRYIEANKLEELCDIMAEKCDGIGESIWNQFRTIVEWSPTADVVEVVQCKDCIHGIPTRIDIETGEFSDEWYCNRHHMCHFEDYYCADGKRNEGDAK